MLKNYIKIAFRNLLRNKLYAIINIGVLAISMAVSIFIGLSIHKELSFNKNHDKYDRIAQVMQHHIINDKVETWQSLPPIMGKGLKDDFGTNFESVCQASWNSDHTLSTGNQAFLREGVYFEPEVIEMFSLNMIRGSKASLEEMHSIVLSQTLAETIFGKENAVGQILKMDNNIDLKVTGVFSNLPENSTFKSLDYILPWKLFVHHNTGDDFKIKPWADGSYTRTYVELADNLKFEEVSSKIKDIRYNKGSELVKTYKPEIFLHPMSKWHLYEEFENGKNIGGLIDNVWLFGVIGFFILILACINFMNLTTARSEKRAKEVGVRKVIGGNRKQLVIQFFSESILVSFLSFLLSLVLVVIALPFFNQILDSNVSVLWNNPVFWIIGLVSSLFVGVIAGIYPSLYLSSFTPVKVLKGTFKTKNNGTTLRQILVVSQFIITIVLVVGTIAVRQQINYGENRFLGYNKEGLVSIPTTKETHNNIDAIRSNLISKGVILNMTESSDLITGEWNGYGGWDWDGKSPDLAANFKFGSVDYNYGKTVGWKIKEGRDFSKEFTDESTQFILNETAVSQMEIENPIGKKIKSGDSYATIIGIVEDLLIESPYESVKPYIFNLTKQQGYVFILKLNPLKSIKESLDVIESEFKSYNPLIPFDVGFVDDEFAKKFYKEKRISRLVTLFAVLAIFISCLGLLGLAIYLTEQRTKEIGIRKVLGASIIRILRLLLKDFIIIVIIACVIAIPIAYYFINTWLQNYEYHISISFWMPIIVCFGIIAVTLLTVSFVSIKTVIINPVKSLRTE